MRRSLWLSVVLIGLLVLSGVVLAAKPVLRVGTDAAYPPFESLDKSGKYVGFDMELIRLVAAEMGRELKLQSVGWDGIIPGLMNGNYDCLISAMTITDERKKQINFSIPYFSIRQAILVKEKNTTIKGPDDLIGKTIAVQTGTTGDLYASEIAKAKLKRFDNNPLAIQELLNNNADAAVMDDLVAFYAMKTNKGLKVIEIKKIAVEDYGIGVKKGNDKLLAEINNAITKLKQNGKLDALVAKYKSSK